MPPPRAILAAAWLVLAVAEQVLVGFAAVAALGCLVALGAAAWWGWRLWRAIRALDDRVGSLEQVVHADADEG